MLSTVLHWVTFKHLRGESEISNDGCLQISYTCSDHFCSEVSEKCIFAANGLGYVLHLRRKKNHSPWRRGAKIFPETWLKTNIATVWRSKIWVKIKKKKITGNKTGKFKSHFWWKYGRKLRMIHDPCIIRIYTITVPTKAHKYIEIHLYT